MKNKRFEILGAHKTGTSTMVGILNCHPDIFCHYEYVVDGKVNKGYVDNKKMERPRRSTRYRWVGDKNPVLGDTHEIDARIARHSDSYIVFCYRNIQDWLCHSSVVQLYGSDVDVVKPSINFLYYLTRSFQFNNIVHIRWDDVVSDTEGEIKKLADFFDVEVEHFVDWWDKVGLWDDNNKLRFKWWVGHNCATKKPTIDIEVEMIDHEFWDTVLPVIEDPEQFTKDDFAILRALQPLPLDWVVKKYKHRRISGGK